MMSARLGLRVLNMYHTVSVYQATRIMVDRLAMALVTTSKLVLFSRQAAITTTLIPRTGSRDRALRQLPDMDNLWRTFHGPLRVNMDHLYL